MCSNIKQLLCVTAGATEIIVRVQVDIASQRLKLFDESGNLIRSYAISSSKRGVGEDCGSLRTPRGKHIIRAKIGAGEPENAVFVRRRPTGEIYTPDLGKAFPGRDWILTRILWLSGCEVGFNRLGNKDTMRRYIYIHGAPDSVPLGRPESHGCVRMHNADVIELFDLVPTGIQVDIIG
jgi:lipoprotein-anchoring transpeptidase ErfK/SrfK